MGPSRSLIRFGRLPPGLALVAGMAFATLPATAATLTVTKTADTADGACDQDCSLREAVIAANASPGGDLIAVPPGIFRLTRIGPLEDASLTGDLNLLGLDVTIDGAGAGVTFIDAGDMAGINERVIQIGQFDSVVNPQATLRDLTITGGRAVTSPEDTGGGIQLDAGIALTLDHVSVDDNYAAFSGAGIQAENGSTLTLLDSQVIDNSTTFSGFGGGMLLSGATVSIDRSLIATNMALDQGGGIYHGGSRDLVIRNSTISGNTARNSGGGVVMAGSGRVTLGNVTVTGNTADDDGSFGDGGGIIRQAGTVTLRNTILAGNRDLSITGNVHPDCSGTAESQGHNVIGTDAGCAFAQTTGDLVGTSAVPIDPRLGPLADNGGPTMTHALLPGSPALEGGDPATAGSGGTACEAIDQRGVPRPQGSGCDIGAYELALCLGLPVNRVGTDGIDNLVGTGGNDAFLGLGGKDSVRGLGGSDRACAGPGNDRLSGGPARDRLAGEGGRDTLRGQGGRDRLRGGPGRDTCLGGPGRDRGACEVERRIP